MSRCRVCNNHQDLETIRVRELFIGTRETFEYVLCHSCRSLSLSSLNQDLAELYEKYPVFDFPPSRTHFWRKFLCREVILRKNVLSRFLLNSLNTWEDLIIKSLHRTGLNKSARILDVGCGNGMLIRMLKMLGFIDVTGIDPYLREPITENGFRLLRSSLEALDEKFDFIMCHHSFEHFENPKDAINEFKRLINPGGTLLIRIPNIESYSFRKFKASWHGIHAPFHFFLPSRPGMQKLFCDSGFEIQEVRQEQIAELFLYNVDLSLDIALMEPLGVIGHVGDGKLGKKLPPTFTKKELAFWREKVKAVKKCNISDYVAYYLKRV